MLLVECNVLEKVQVIREGTNANPKVLLRGKFQKCDEQNNNGRVYPRKVLESQVKTIQEKVGDRSLVGALDHPSNDAIHLSQASHLITKLWVEKNGDVMGECEILSTPNGKIVAALINDGVKIGISSRGLGSVSEGEGGKVVNEDFKLITFDLVSDPSTKGAFPELTESIRENSQRAKSIISKHKKERVLLAMLESKIDEALTGSRKKGQPKTAPGHQGKDYATATVGSHAKSPVSKRPGTPGRGGSTETVVSKYKSHDAEGKPITATAVDVGTEDGETKQQRKTASERKRARSQRNISFSSGADPQNESERCKSLKKFAKLVVERCWKDYKPAKGKKAYSKGSCVRK